VLKLSDMFTVCKWPMLHEHKTLIWRVYCWILLKLRLEMSF